MNTIIPADDLCPFPVEVKTTQWFNVVTLTASPSIKVEIKIDADFVKNRQPALDQLRRILVRKMYSDKSSDFFKLLSELKMRIYSPLGCSDYRGIEEILHKMSALMRYGQTGGNRE